MVNIIKKTKDYNDSFVLEVVNFFKYFADQRHHGKEEDILFNELMNKKVSEEHNKIMNGLVNDHKNARVIISELEKLPLVEKREELLNKIIKMYPQHIETEDKNFFIPVMSYFTEDEQNEMFERMNKFDSNLNDEKYKQIVEKYEK
jgi:hemerythrin-like domain-containing protein